MSFTDHKITAFAHRVSDLPDQPTLPPDELKARFDSSAEELRVALGAVCDDADRLDARVAGIVVDTFGDSIDKSMLSDELQDEIDAKATQTALAAEAAAREAADTVETAAREALAEVVAQKCEVYFGTYTGNGASNRLIELGFQPKAVLSLSNGVTMYSYGTYGGLAFPDHPVKSGGRDALVIEENGFRVYFVDNSSIYTNRSGDTYIFLAFQ